MTDPESRPEGSIRRMIAISMAARMLVDTTNRIFHPYLTIIAAGLGVNVVVLGTLVSLRGLIGILALPFGELAEHLSYRFVMRLGLVLSALGLFLFGASLNVWMAALGMLLMGIGLAIFIPMLRAYLSARLPYARRAWGLGMVEYSYALAGFAGLFLAGQLISIFNWRLPFFLLGGGLLVAWRVFGDLDGGRPVSLRGLVRGRDRSRGWRERVAGSFSFDVRGRSAWGTVVVAGLSVFAAMHVMITHGVWLNREYGFTAAHLGGLALLLGVVDFAGTGLVTLVVDRLGKRRSVLLGSAASALALLAFPMLNVTLPLAIAGLAAITLTCGFTIVSIVPLASEQLPTQRGKMLTLASTFNLLGVTVSGISGPWSYLHFGLWGLGAVSAAAMLVSLVVILLWVEEDGGTPQPALVPVTVDEETPARR